MAFTNKYYGRFAGLADSASLPAGLTKRGTRGYIQGGLLRYQTDDFSYLSNDVYAAGSDDEIDSEIEVLLPAGFVNGDTLALGLRNQTYKLDGETDPFPGEKGCLLLRMVRASDMGAVPRIGVGAVSSSNRIPTELISYYGSHLTGLDDAKAYWLRFRAVGTTTIALSFELWEDNGADTSSGNTAAAHGASLYAWSGTLDATASGFQYLQRPGVACVLGTEIAGANGGTDNDAKIAALRVATQPNTVPLSAPTPTRTARTASASTLTAAPANGVPPYTIEWYSKADDPTVPATAENLIPSAQYSDGGLTLTHTHGDAPGTIRFYRYKVTDADSPGASVTSGVRMVEALRPAPGALPALRPDLLAGRKLLYCTWGDSISKSEGIQTQVIADLATQGIDNVTLVNGAWNGTSLSESNGWTPDAAPYVDSGLPAGVNLFDRFAGMITDALTANPGALVVISGMILTNDALRYTSAMTKSAIQADFESFFAEMATRFPSAKQIINCQPYATLGTISLDAHVAEIAWRQATLDAIAASKANGVDAEIGDRALYAEVNRTPTHLADGVHFTSAGNVAAGHLWSDALMRNVLLDEDAPYLSSAAVNAAGNTLVLTFSEAVTGVNAPDFTLSGGHTLSAVSGSGNSRTLAISPTVLSSETVTLSYSGSGVSDAANNAMALFAGSAVTNNSLITPGGGTGPVSSGAGLIVSMPLLASEMNPVTLREGDTGPSRMVQLGDSQGRPFPIPVGAIVIYRLRWRTLPGIAPPPEAPPLIEGAATVVAGFLGIVRFDFPNPLPMAGQYREEWSVVDSAGSGQIITFPSNSYVPVTIKEILS